MNHNDFFKLIAADGLRGAYLLQGEEEFVKASALKAAEKLIPEDFRAFNMSVLYEPDADALTEACRCSATGGLLSATDWHRDSITRNLRTIFKKCPRVQFCSSI